MALLKPLFFNESEEEKSQNKFDLAENYFIKGPPSMFILATVDNSLLIPFIPLILLPFTYP